ncbi:hypothetical protein NDU88_005918 [Pleurodeles waltl]|uniref:Uncharacterized protein n=1 Tax=Pleurodeles waltl TaxID=8319 RepID=A0AAV7TCG3_PLEWA|nr:hypothetical protein NDU88_005918 [Pleurodeles waltl]
MLKPEQITPTETLQLQVQSCLLLLEMSRKALEQSWVRLTMVGLVMSVSLATGGKGCGPPTHSSFVTVSTANLRQETWVLLEFR